MVLKGPVESLRPQTSGFKTCTYLVTAKGFNKRHADLQHAIYIIKLLQTAVVDRLETCYFQTRLQLLCRQALRKAGNLLFSRPTVSS